MVAVERRSPTGVPAADAIPVVLRRQGGTPRQVFAVALIGTLTLAVFASHDLSTWLDRLGDGVLLAPLQHAARDWDVAMTRVGLARPAASGWRRGSGQESEGLVPEAFCVGGVECIWCDSAGPAVAVGDRDGFVAVFEVAAADALQLRRGGQQH